MSRDESNVTIMLKLYETHVIVYNNHMVHWFLVICLQNIKISLDFLNHFNSREITFDFRFFCHYNLIWWHVYHFFNEKSN